MNVTTFFNFCLCIISAVGKVRRTVFARYVPLNDRNVTTAVISWSQGNSSVGCASLCGVADTCESFFYNPGSGECQFHRTLFMTTAGAEEQKGMRYYYKVKGRNGWCPVDDGYQMLAEAGPCVKFHTEIQTWSVANQTCASYSPYSQLVVLDSQVKNDLVSGAGKAINHLFSGGVYIGLSDLQNNIYRWVDGTYLDFTNWKLDRTEGPAGTNCVYFFRTINWKWSSTACGGAGNFICEIVVDAQMYLEMMANII